MLINRKHVRDYALSVARARRVQPFCRVGARFYTRAEGALRTWIEEEIKSLPSKGVTIR